jgi:RNAse (barnase) inhibitor barstar
MIYLEQSSASVQLPNEHIAWIDCNVCRTLNDFYFQIQQALQLPDYFGYNLDALEEVLQDIPHNEEKISTKLILTNYDMLCLEEPEENKKTLLDILQQAEGKQFQIIALK